LGFVGTGVPDGPAVRTTKMPVPGEYDTPCFLKNNQLLPSRLGLDQRTVGDAGPYKMCFVLCLVCCIIALVNYYDFFEKA